MENVFNKIKSIIKELKETGSIEKWTKNDKWCWYIVTLGLKSFKIGITLGIENTIYLGFVCFGVDKY